MVFNPDGRTVLCAMQDSLKVNFCLHLGPAFIRTLLMFARLFSFLLLA